MKRCPKCDQEKSADEFHKSRRRKDGLHPYCKLCRSEESQKPETKQYKRRWYDDHQKEISQRAKARYALIGDELREYRKKHYEANSDSYKLKSHKWYLEHKCDPDFIEKRKARRREWEKNNKHVTAWRSLLRSTVKRLGQTKKSSTQELLGYNPEQLRTHLESQWLPGMSWENYGDWHIDHIKLVSSFDNSADIAVVNALTNLRPLWATSRIIDGVAYQGNLNRDKK